VDILWIYMALLSAIKESTTRFVTG